MNFNEGLNKFGPNLNLHAKLINTFSLMEYIGGRKILKSQLESKVTEALLSHVAEEVRHAMTLKRLALKLSDGGLHSYGDEHVLGGQAARHYMQKVDRGAADYFKSDDAWKNYLLTTWLIEERALLVYPLYEEVMESLGHKGYFKMILKDEERHSQFIEDEIKIFAINSEDQKALLALENAAFAEFCEAVFKVAE